MRPSLVMMAFLLLVPMRARSHLGHRGDGGMSRSLLI
jgi:hypothetical protein